MTTYKETNPNSKRGQAVLVMIENQDKPMLEVIPMIAKAISVSDSAARSYYKYIVEEGYGPGKVDGGRLKTKQISAKKMLKDLNIHTESNRLIAKAIKSGAIKVPEVKVTKSPEEIERIRAANLAKMQEITSKHKKQKVYLKGQIAEEQGPGVENFDPEEARAEVAAILNDEGINRVVPKFLQD